MVVLGIILVAVFLANVVLNIIGSHPRLTHHQISRIQAYYAAWAGISYAYDRITAGDASWPVPAPTGSYTRTITDNDPATGFPRQIVNQQVVVVVQGRNLCPSPVPTGVNACINATVNYQYTP